ncbi:hypothetical protein C8J57DRAFT_1726330 [Mycena rebaudengoi]|nr:hypothetical protein C8J57DRAFT_1726330 [Mycena rebaudengoi]
MLFTPALTLRAILPRPIPGSAERPCSALSPSYLRATPFSDRRAPSYCWLTHLLVAPSSRALRRQLTHGFARLSIVPRNAIPRPWLSTSFVVSLHRTAQFRSDYILYFSCRHSSRIICPC